MKTQVLDIQSNNNDDSLMVLMSIGEEQRSFIFSRFFDQLGEVKLQVIEHDQEFWETFKFNQQIASEVMSLVRQFYKGEKVQLPLYVGDFGTMEEALALQKPRKPENLTMKPASSRQSG
ncbi:hypothetical protein [Chroococcus sp. FPU101]|uniref:hypothetical protein n=1 Tax=Chroococcus sp. FPU101 TaxID=1974212 RepID=UPI001A8C5DD7|nr:hypothetical protein [Chroococcus sp. FPU101]GFE71887.1 hypothetical protein CFPU101_44970 [Chroococcus sp. FPU101]